MKYSYEMPSVKMLKPEHTLLQLSYGYSNSSYFIANVMTVLQTNFRNITSSCHYVTLNRHHW
jgi:hypothetical protein